jgi:hypothetical protein
MTVKRYAAGVVVSITCVLGGKLWYDRVNPYAAAEDVAAITAAAIERRAVLGMNGLASSTAINWTNHVEFGGDRAVGAYILTSNLLVAAAIFRDCVRSGSGTNYQVAFVPASFDWPGGDGSEGWRFRWTWRAATVAERYKSLRPSASTNVYFSSVLAGYSVPTIADRWLSGADVRGVARKLTAATNAWFSMKAESAASESSFPNRVLLAETTTNLFFGDRSWWRYAGIGDQEFNIEPFEITTADRAVVTNWSSVNQNDARGSRYLRTAHLDTFRQLAANMTTTIHWDPTFTGSVASNHVWGRCMTNDISIGESGVWTLLGTGEGGVYEGRQEATGTNTSAVITLGGAEMLRVCTASGYLNERCPFVQSNAVALVNIREKAWPTLTPAFIPQDAYDMGLVARLRIYAAVEMSTPRYFAMGWTEDSSFTGPNSMLNFGSWFSEEHVRTDATRTFDPASNSLALFQNEKHGWNVSPADMPTEEYPPGNANGYYSDLYMATNFSARLLLDTLTPVVAPSFHWQPGGWASSDWEACAGPQRVYGSFAKSGCGANTITYDYRWRHQVMRVVYCIAVVDWNFQHIGAPPVETNNPVWRQ